MSDQVIFTKEEVARLRVIIDGYYHVCKECDMPAWGEDAIEGLALLDSPRPSPKISMKWFIEVSESNWIPEIEAAIKDAGFDVED